MNRHDSNLSRRRVLAAAGSLGVTALVPNIGMAATDDTIAGLIAEMDRSPRAMRDGFPPPRGSDAPDTTLPDNSHEQCLASAARSRELAARARRLRARTADPDEAETLDVLIWDLDRDSALAPFYWHEFPLGYLGSQVGLLSRELQVGEGDDARSAFLSRLRQAPRFVEHIQLRLLGQVERRLTAPRAEVVRALAALRTHRQRLMDALMALSNAANSGFETETRNLVQGPLAASFEALVQAIERDYLPHVDESSAVTKAEDARAYQHELLRHRVSDGLEPMAEHQAAKESLAAIDADLARMRRSLGVEADADLFHRAMSRDPRWLARDADDIAARLNRGAAAIEPLLHRYFSRLPSAPGGVAPVAPELVTTLLNGTYEGPTEAKPSGTYYFNPSGLDITNWSWATPLIAHELLPGHHLQFAMLFEARYLIDYRRDFFVGGNVEGWGEYARQLMEEAGLYANDPWGLYASRLLERRFALRAAVETGVHLPDWSWQEADVQLASDPLTRPGTSRQIALAAATFRTNGTSYWRGLKSFMALRRAAETHAGARFDIRAFHGVVMRGDAVPFAVLEQRLRNAALLPPAGSSLAGSA